MRIKFNSKYILPFTFIFLTEVIIALFVHDSVIRPYVGDVLVVILLYFFVRMLTNIGHFRAAIGVFIFSCIVEITQYFNLIAYLHLQDYKLAGIILGTTFNFEDFFAYLIGTLIILISPIINRKIKQEKLPFNIFKNK